MLSFPRTASVMSLSPVSRPVLGQLFPVGRRGQAEGHVGVLGVREDEVAGGIPVGRDRVQLAVQAPVRDAPAGSGMDMVNPFRPR